MKHRSETAPDFRTHSHADSHSDSVLRPSGEMRTSALKKGLILEGGAMRGLFTAGVLDVFMENDVVFDGIIGVSAGAAFGCNFKSRQPGRVLRYNKKYCRDPRYCSFRSLFRTGDLFGADFCYRELPRNLDRFDVAAFEENPMEFYLVCTDAVTGRPVYHQCEPGDAEIFEWFRASASMPLVSRPVSAGGYRLLDGGISDSIPIRFLESRHYERNVIILTQPEGYEKKPLRFHMLLRLLLWRCPSIYAALSRRHEVYNDVLRHIREQERRGTLYVLRPPVPIPVGHIEHNPERLQKAYEIGRNEAQKRLPEILKFLQTD